MKFDDDFEQLSPLMDDFQMAMEIVKAATTTQYPFGASQIFIEVHGELLQVTLDYVERCGRIVEATMRRMSEKQVQ